MEIIANDQGNRTTPSYVAFTDSERLIGDPAKSQVKRMHLTRFMKRRLECLYSGGNQPEQHHLRCQTLDWTRVQRPNGPG